MAEPTQYAFDLREAATALIKHQGIHEGIWMIAVEFTLSAGLIGPSSAEVRPSAIAQVNKLMLTQAPEAVPLAVNAAEVNPVPASEARPRSIVATRKRRSRIGSTPA
jgi:hypothetical protein